MLIQIDIPKDIHKKLQFYKLEKDHTRLSNCVEEIIIKYFEVDESEQSKDW